jgi:serine/threonine-protein kinase
VTAKVPPGRGSSRGGGRSKSRIPRSADESGQTSSPADDVPEDDGSTDLPILARPDSDPLGVITPTPTFVGDYQIIRRLEGGGMADVFLAHKMARFGFVRRALIKRVKRSRPGYQNLQRALLDEARATSCFDHPNIVQLLDVGDDDQGVYLAIEFIEGTDLRWVNSKLRARKEALPFELACYITGEILRGLHHAHHAVDPDGHPLEIVHRDVNPSNVLISYTGHVKLADFGVVRMRDRLQQKTEVGLVKGKYAYLAPEYIAGESCNLQTDIYAAGVMLFELLCGRECFTGQTAYEVMWKIVNRGVPLYRLEREGVPDDLGRIVQRAVNPVPERRYESAQEMANALETWLMRSGKHATPWVLSVFFQRHSLYPVREEQAIPESRRLLPPGTPDRAIQPMLQAPSGRRNEPSIEAPIEAPMDLAFENPVEAGSLAPFEPPIAAAARNTPAPEPVDDGQSGAELEHEARVVISAGTKDIILDPPPRTPAPKSPEPLVEAKKPEPPPAEAPKPASSVDVKVLDPSGDHDVKAALEATTPPSVPAKLLAEERRIARTPASTKAAGTSSLNDGPWADRLSPPPMGKVEPREDQDRDPDESEEPTIPAHPIPNFAVPQKPKVETLAQSATEKMPIMPVPEALSGPHPLVEVAGTAPPAVTLKDSPPILLDDVKFEDPIEAPIPEARTPVDDSLTPMPSLEQLESQPIGPLGTVPWGGKLEEIPGTEALDRLAKAGASGRLEFKCGLIWKRVQLDQGTPIGITSNMGMELIGEHLVKGRFLSRRELDRALRESEREGRPLTAKLLELGLVDRQNLEVELGKNLAARLGEVLEWRWGTFEFIPEAAEPATIRPRLDLDALISDAIHAREKEPPPDDPSSGPNESAQSKLKEAFKRARSIAQSTGKGRVDNVGNGRQPTKR